MTDSISSQIMEMVSMRPTMSYELPGPLRRIGDRVRMINRWHEKYGSHWRIRGTRIFDPAAGFATQYRFVMENL